VWRWRKRRRAKSETERVNNPFRFDRKAADAPVLFLPPNFFIS